MFWIPLMLLIWMRLMVLLLIDIHDYDDDTDDDNDHKKDSYTAAGAAPTQTRPGHARPQKYFMFSLFWHEWVSDRPCEALDPPKCRFLRALSIWMGPRADLYG